jgi:hypothetical protein
MSVPVVYSDARLVRSMQAWLGSLRDVLDLPGYEDAVIATKSMLGVSDLADVTDIEKLRRYGRYAAWDAVVQATAGKFDVSTDGQSLSRSQQYDHAVAQLARAYAGLSAYIPAGGLMVATISYSDPYSVSSDEEF